jgi:hypothetical protein
VAEPPKINIPKAFTHIPPNN